MKPATEIISKRLRPMKLASQPVIGRITALATRYDVSAHVASSTVADRLPAMCGSDTLTTVVSSTSMNVANMTEIAMIQGLTCGWDGILISHVLLTFSRKRLTVHRREYSVARQSRCSPRAGPPTGRVCQLKRTATTRRRK